MGFGMGNVGQLMPPNAAFSGLSAAMLCYALFLIHLFNKFVATTINRLQRIALTIIIHPKRYGIVIDFAEYSIPF